MKRKIIITAILGIILTVVCFPYIKEYKYYSNAKEEKGVYACNEYLENYPDGRYAEEIRYLKIGYSNNSFDAINEYLYYYPEGQYAGEVNATCDRIWDEEIAKYNSRDKSKESQEAVKFMTEMLSYMKSHRINRVLVDVTSHLQLKDYNEYDSRVRELLEATNDKTISIEDGMISLKSNFSETDVSSLKQILSEGVQKSLDKMFTPGFITVDTETEEVENMPKLHFDYTIKSQEDKALGMTIPHLWVYSDDYRVKNFLIGISISFKVNYTIPGSSTTFEYSEKGEPAENINNVDDISDGYRRMTSICFAEFSNKMAKNMGLKETYFQGEE